MYAVYMCIPNKLQGNILNVTFIIKKHFAHVFNLWKYIYFHFYTKIHNLKRVRWLRAVSIKGKINETVISGCGVKVQRIFYKRGSELGWSRKKQWVWGIGGQKEKRCDKKYIYVYI